MDQFNGGGSDGLVAHNAFVSDLDPQGVEEDQRIDRFQRPALPGGDLVEHGVGDSADEIGRDLDAIKLAQMPDDLPALMPLAYIEMILSSKPGKRRWYLAISCGSNVA